MRSRLSVISLGIAGALAVVLAVSCSGSGSDVLGGSARVRVMITDAPSDYVASAMVTISRVYLVPAGKEAGPVDILGPDEGPLTYDLVQLRDGLEELLGDRVVPEGTYDQLRLVVDQADVTLVDGVTFDDGTSNRSLRVPSGSQSGIKVQLGEPIVAEDGTMTVVVVDFDVNDNFVLQGNPDTPAGIHGILFTPTLKEKRRQTVTSGS